jgi:hypothetical protein
MRFLRMLTNSVLGGGLVAAYLAVLVLQLNPHLPLAPLVVATLYRVLLLFYGTHLALAIYVVLVLSQLVSRDGFSPGWLSLRLLAWMATLAASAVALVTWRNLQTYGATLAPESADALAAGAAATALCAVLLCIIGFVHFSFGRRGSRLGGALFALTVVASVVLPLVARGGARPGLPARGEVRPQPVAVVPTAGRITLVLLDGVSLEFIAPLTADGRLPNFGRILDGGASAHLTTIRPTHPGPVWTAAATGKLPLGNGVRSGATFDFGDARYQLDLLPDLCFAHALVHFGVVSERPHTAASVRARTFWEIASAAGVPVGIAGWPLTAPAPPVHGYIASDRLHLSGGARVAFEDEALVSPPEAAALVSAVSADVPAAEDAPLGALAREPYARDRWYRHVATALDERFAPRLSALRYEGPDVVGHRYLRYALPRAFGDVSAEELREFGSVLEAQYGWIDRELGREMQALGPDDVLLVVSGFGMEPVSLGKRVLSELLRESSLSGTHENGPDGFLLAWGAVVRRGRLPLGSITDLAPTVLYLLGLPIGRDMDGHARTDLFVPAFTQTRPITFIPTYER